MLPSQPVEPAARAARRSPGERWLTDLLESVERLANRCHTRHHTRVLPCLVDGAHTLVHERGLQRRQPFLHAWLRQFCDLNRVRLLEDRRGNELPVLRDRRRNLASVVAMAASLLAPTASLAEAGTPGSSAATEQAAAAQPRPDEHADVAGALRISAETRRRGNPTPVAATQPVSSDWSLSSAVIRYDHDVRYGGSTQRFSYFEGDGLHALGRQDDGSVAIDVFLGGGPATAPRLWGSFEEVAHDTVDVHLLVGAGEQDSFGILKASYTVAIGPAPAGTAPVPNPVP